MSARLTTFATSRISQFTSQFTSQLHRQQRNMTTLKLNTGASIPAVGFGTWQDKDDQEIAVAEALSAGYKHIDTARSMLSPAHQWILTNVMQSMELNQWLELPLERVASLEEISSSLQSSGTIATTQRMSSQLSMPLSKTWAWTTSIYI